MRKMITENKSEYLRAVQFARTYNLIITNRCNRSALPRHLYSQDVANTTDVATSLMLFL